MIHIVYDTEHHRFTLIDDTDYSTTTWYKNIPSLLKNITELHDLPHYWSLQDWLLQASTNKLIEDALRPQDSLFYSLPATVIDMPYQEITKVYPELFV